MQMLSLLSLLLCCAFTQAQDFFNTKDLTGWKGLENLWSVKDGMIHASPQPKGINFNTFLYTEKDMPTLKCPCRSS